MHKSAIVIANAAHRIRTCKPFTANGFQDRSLTTRTYGKYSSVVELLYPEIAFATTLYNFMRTFYRLRQTFFQVYCRKLAQCVGLEPTRRINARPDSNRLQFHYGNTAKFSCIVKNIGKETTDTLLQELCPQVVLTHHSATMLTPGFNMRGRICTAPMVASTSDLSCRFQLITYGNIVYLFRQRILTGKVGIEPTTS